MNLCYDSTGWNFVLNPRSDWQPMEGSEQRLCVVSPSFAKDKTSCIVLETRQQRAAVIPKEGKMKPASSSYQQMACAGGEGGGGGGTLFYTTVGRQICTEG